MERTSVIRVPFSRPRGPPSRIAVRPLPRSSGIVLQPRPPWHTDFPGKPCTRMSISYPPASIRLLPLLRADARLFDDARPLGRFVGDELAELGRAHRPCLGALGVEPLLRIGGCCDRGKIPAQQVES